MTHSWTSPLPGEVDFLSLVRRVRGGCPGGECGDTTVPLGRGEAGTSGGWALLGFDPGQQALAGSRVLQGSASKDLLRPLPSGHELDLAFHGYCLEVHSGKGHLSAPKAGFCLGVSCFWAPAPLTEEQMSPDLEQH